MRMNKSAEICLAFLLKHASVLLVMLERNLSRVVFSLLSGLKD